MLGSVINIFSESYTY